MRRNSSPVIASSSGIPVYSNSNRRRVAIQNYPAFTAEPAAPYGNMLVAQNTQVSSNGIDARYLQDPLPAGSTPTPAVATISTSAPPAEPQRATAELIDTTLVQPQSPRTASDKRGGDQAFVY